MPEQYVTKADCKERRQEKTEHISTKIAEVEKRIYTILKQHMSLIEKGDAGHKEALQTAMGHVQTQLTNGEARFTRLEAEDKKVFDELAALGRELATLQTELASLRVSDLAHVQKDFNDLKEAIRKKFKYFYYVTGSIVIVFIAALMNEGNWTATFKTIVNWLELLLKLIFG